MISNTNPGLPNKRQTGILLAGLDRQVPGFSKLSYELPRFLSAGFFDAKMPERLQIPDRPVEKQQQGSDGEPQTAEDHECSTA